MNKHILFRILAGLVILAAIAGIAVFAFQMGMARGAVLNLPAGSNAAPQLGPGLEHGFGRGFGGMPFRGHMGFFNPFGFLKCLIPLFLLFLVFAFFRRMMWGRHMMGGHGPWGDHGHGPWGHHTEGEGVPSRFEEWHRRSHEKSAEKPADAPVEPPSA